MGAWGRGLYANDFALDLRATIAAIAKLPFDGPELLRLARESEPGAAARPDDPDHATFWLVVAQQFARRGIAAPEAAARARGLLAALEPADAKRRAELAALAREIEGAPERTVARRTLAAPQPLLFVPGDAFAFPVMRGKGINPFFPVEAGLRGFRPDGRAVCVIVQAGRAFGYLAWYVPLMLADAVAEDPPLAALAGSGPWAIGTPGTYGRSQFRRMQAAPIGRMAIDEAKLAHWLGPLKDGRSAAVSDISMCNTMHIRPAMPDRVLVPPGEQASIRGLRQARTVARLGDILA
ncbi:hypothetical protein [Falsiroseomonas sp. HW251]|uniref:hypothetical protein n=1 Tax=Falsiroseomonas sp. HW251 TaxID=3390998 RepID=UPI003D317D88